MNPLRNPLWPRVFLGLVLALAPLGAQGPLKPLAPAELELLRAGLPARQELARAALARIQKEEKLGEAHGFRARRAYLDDFGQVHVRNDQTYKGVRVWDGMAIVHLGADGRALEPTLALRRDLAQSVEPQVPLHEAQAIALDGLEHKDVVATPHRNELVLYPRLGERIGPVAPRPDGKLNAEDLDRHADYHFLAWHIRLTGQTPDGGFFSRDYIVDALDGTVRKSWDSLQTSAVVGTGKSQYSGNVNLNTNSTGGGFEMRDLTRPTQPHPFLGFTGNATHNLNHSTDSSSYLTGTIYTDPDNTWGDNANYIPAGSTTNDNGQTAAVDAHYGLQATWDYFKNVHNWNGIDNLGSAALNRVHYGTNYANAFWSDECFCMTYGDGAGSTKVLTQLDVAGHEMAHGVMSETAGMVYQDEPGGLNESNSDIFACMTEFYTKGGGTGSTVPNTAPGANWTLGEQIWTTPLRYMFKPSLDGASLDEWTVAMGLNDVHFTSGPMNRAFYFLAQGATTSGDTSTPRLPSGMTGIGNHKAARIWFRAVSVYLTPFSFYLDARGACIRSARDLYGSGSSEVAAVKNAFAGINVGGIAGSDDSDPVLSVSGPGTATGSVVFSTSPTDNVGIAQVDWFLDGVWWATRTSAPYNLTLDSTQIANGAHELRARARDAAGNIGQSNLFAFNSSNTTEQLIFNPGIESGDFGWGYNLGGTLWYSPTGTNAHSGNYFIWLCGYGQTVTNEADQFLHLPADATSLNLSFWLKVSTQETTTTIQYDKLAIRVYASNGSTILGTLATLSNLDAGGYVQRTYNLMPYKGQDVFLVFWGTEDSSDATSFFVDDVTITATVPPPIVVTVSPKPVTLVTGGAATFTAAVTGTGNTAVNWTIASGGGSLSGSTGASVTYTAPATAGTAVVRATSQADGSKFDSATVTIRSRDLNGDGLNDVLDLAHFARAHGATPSSSNWNALCDLNGDGVVDDTDITLFLAGF